ncbi:MAG: hypothetical protein JWL71_437 [Acidobacteria bacterium]|nr:hypothetical protein [Acidobacteriota bacterium]
MEDDSARVRMRCVGGANAGKEFTCQPGVSLAIKHPDSFVEHFELYRPDPDGNELHYACDCDARGMPLSQADRDRHGYGRPDPA